MTEKMEVDLEEIRQLTSWLAASDIGFIEVRRRGTTVRLEIGGSRDSRDGASQRASVSALTRQPHGHPHPNVVDVTADAVGVFLTSYPTRSAPFVEPGSRVARGDMLAVLRIADLCLPVVAPLAGIVTQPLMAHGAIASYGTPLFKISSMTIACAD